MDREEILALQTYLRHDHPEGEQQLILFRRQYLQKLPFKHITFPPSELLQLYDVQRYLYTFLCDPPASEFRPKLDHDVLAELVKRIESAVASAEEPDIYDPIVELAAELCLRPRLPLTEAVQRDVWVTYESPEEADILKRSRGIKLLEKPQILASTGCTGYATWQAALSLANELMMWIKQGKLRGKRVLELGAGTGLLSFLCAKEGDVDLMVSTDGDADAVERLKIMKEINGHHETGKTTFGVYRWGEDFAGTVVADALENGVFEIVLAADVVSLDPHDMNLTTLLFRSLIHGQTYDPSSHDSLVKTFSMLLAANPSTMIVVSAPVRNQSTSDSFIAECSGCFP